MTIQIKSRGRGGCCSFFMVSAIILSIIALMVSIFAFSIKWSEEYACTIQLVQNHELVIEELGRPIQPGLVAWTQNYERDGGEVRAAFTTSVSGPRGSGQIRTNAYRSHIGHQFFLVEYNDQQGEWVQLHSGSNPCG